MTDVEFVDTVLGRIRLQVTSGSGDAIVFWPSLLMTGEMWARQADHFGDRCRVILVDPPGHGGSQPLKAMFSFDDCARCIVEILDGLGIDRAHFAGNSWGGMIGGTFAARHPDRIGRAVLMNCTASAAGPRQKVEYAILLRLAKILGGIRPPLTRSVLRGFLGPTTVGTRPDVVETVRSRLEAINVASSAWAVRSVVPARPDQHRLLGQVRAPVLVVAGAEDATFPVAETRRMADAIPSASSQEDPARVNLLIDEFLFPPSAPQT